jgi:hypothetical protein
MKYLLSNISNWQNRIVVCLTPNEIEEMRINVLNSKKKIVIIIAPKGCFAHENNE